MKNPIVLGLLALVVAGAVMMIIHGNPVGLRILGTLLGGLFGVALLWLLDSSADVLRDYRNRKR